MTPVVVVQCSIGSTVYLWSDGPYTAVTGQAADPRLVGDVTYTRAALSALWTRRQTESGPGTITIANNDGAVDALLGVEVTSSSRVYVYWLDADSDGLTDSTMVAAGYVDRIESVGETAIRIITSDVLGRLDRPLTEVTFSGLLDAVNGRPAPVTLGRPRSCPILLVDDIDYLYDVHDVSSNTSVELVRDAGVVLSEGARWITAPSPRIGIELQQLPVGTIVSDLAGSATTTQVFAISETAGDFVAATWSGSPATPPGWVINLDGGGQVTDGGINGAYVRIATNTGFLDRARLRSTATLDDGQLYTIRIDVPGFAFAAPLEVWEIGPDHLIATISDAGTTIVSWRAHGGALELRVTGSVANPFPGAHVALVTAYRRTITPSVLHRWDEALFAVAARADLDMLGSEIDLPGITAAAAEWPRGVSYFTISAPSCRQVIDQIADSVLALIYADARGRLSASLLAPPPLDATPVVSIVDADIIGGISVSMDRAGNVPAAVSAGRNWHVYSADDLADDITDNERAMLSAEYRFRAPVGALSSEITPRRSVGDRVSVGAENQRKTDVGMPTLLDSQADADALAARIAGLFPPNSIARWIELTAWLPRDSLRTLRPGSLVRITSERWQLAGVLTVLVSIQGVAGRSTARLLLWRPIAIETQKWNTSGLTWQAPAGTRWDS